MLKELLLVVHVLVAIAIVGLVLLQQGQGADIGAAFGTICRSIGKVCSRGMADRGF